MGDQEQKLLDGVKAVAQGEDDLEKRVDAIIEALKAPHDSPVVAQAIADLEALKLREQGYRPPTQAPTE